jgi:beta-fructofuranosidase
MLISRRNFLQFSAVAAGARLLPLPPDSADSALCRKLASDPLRPQYHLLPAHNWMNDPNGPIFFRGRYHMFYQYNPQAAVWGNMHWAHATSPDMIHWQHQPIALAPTPHSPDSDGVFSGSAVLDHGTPTVIYTGVAPPASASEATLRDGVHTWRETQCLAVAEDDSLRSWKKLPAPIIAAPPAGLDVTGFRDPCLWREAGKWMLILGSGTRQQGGMALLYTSSNLRDWTYLHPLVTGSPSGSNANNPVASGDMWECPDFFPLDNKRVLLVSTMGKVHWKIGTYTQQRFTPEKEGVVDWGAYYAAKTMLDRDGNRILWGWIRETRPDADLIAAGWAGVMSLPRVLSLSAENDLQMEVLPSAASLRGLRTATLNLVDQERALDRVLIRDLAAELELTTQSKDDEFSITLQSDAGDFAAISCTRRDGRRELRVNEHVAPVPGNVGSPISFHIFCDGSVLEIFANRTVSLTTRIYKIPSGPLRLTRAGNFSVNFLNVWQLKPISKDRLTGSLCS